jgi:hypothetical protein
MGHWRQWCVLVVTIASTALAHAEPSPEAEKLFRDGRALAKQGKLAEACDAFAASNKLGTSVGTLLNLGDCRAKLGQTATAWATFVEAGRLAKKQSDRRGAEADRRAAELEPKLSYLVIQVDAPAADQRVLRDSTLIDPAVFGQAVPLDPGTYEIHAEGPGLVAWSQKVTIKPDGARETVRVSKLPRAVTTAPAASAAAIGPDAASEPSAGTERDALASRFTTRRKIALAAGGAGVLALGGSTLLALRAKSMHDDARKACPTGAPCRDLAASDKSKQAVSRANLATIVGGVGIAALAAGAVLWIMGAPPESSAVVRIAPAATPDSVGMTVTGSF